MGLSVLHRLEVKQNEVQPRKIAVELQDEFAKPRGSFFVAKRLQVEYSATEHKIDDNGTSSRFWCRYSNREANGAMWLLCHCRRAKREERIGPFEMAFRALVSFYSRFYTSNCIQFDYFIPKSLRRREDFIEEQKEANEFPS